MLRQLVVGFAAAMLGVSAFAQVPAAAPAAAAGGKVMKDAVTGTMDITFATRTNVDDKGAPVQGAQDDYKCNLVIGQTIGVQGNIFRQPQVAASGFLARTFKRGGQAAQFQYDLDWHVIVGGKDLNVGKFVGIMPIDTKTNAFVLDGNKDMPLRNDIRQTGQVQAFQDAYSGKIFGKAVDKASLMDKVLTRTVGGKTVSAKVQKADPLRFENVVLAKGPVPMYGKCTVNGSMIYSYETADYFIDNLTFSYTTRDGKNVTDRVTGTIHWAKDPNYSSNGKSRYEFNVRYNEPVKDETAAVQATEDEAAFFAVDPNANTLGGTIEFVDTKSGDTVAGSKVVYKLEATGLDKTQVLNFMKLWMLVVGPTNDE